jgi:predicted nucleotide-binding protein
MSKVFIIHGRDLRPVSALATFLEGIGVEHLTFDEAERILVSEGRQTYIYEIVRRGIEDADAVIGLLTPDETALLYDPASGKPSATDPHAYRWQARANVFFELGVAFALKPARTIMATLHSDVSALSGSTDLAGFRVVEMEKPGVQNRLANLLVGMGLNVNTVGANAIQASFAAFTAQLWPPRDDVADIIDRMHQTHTRNGLTLGSAYEMCEGRADPASLGRTNASELCTQIEALVGRHCADDVFFYSVALGLLQPIEPLGDRWFDDPGNTWRSAASYWKVSEIGRRVFERLRIYRVRASTAPSSAG